MTTLNAYVLRLTVKPLFVAVLIELLLLLVERMLRLLDLVLGSKGSLDVLIKLLTFLVPHYMCLATSSSASRTRRRWTRMRCCASPGTSA